MNAQQLTLRFSGASWMDQPREVVIAGVGSVGSMLALYLSKQVRKMSFFDPDTVEAHNIGTQLFSHEQIGIYKAIAMREVLEVLTTDDRSTLSIQTYGYRWYKYDVTSGDVFSCVDSIKVREQIFNDWLGFNNARIFVDVRMAAEFGQVFFVDRQNQEQIDAYKKSLEGDFPEAACTLKMTIQCAALMAGLAVQGYNSFCAGFPPPFETYFNGKTFMFSHSSPQDYLYAENESPTEQLSSVPEHNDVENVIVSEAERLPTDSIS